MRFATIILHQKNFRRVLGRALLSASISLLFLGCATSGLTEVAGDLFVPPSQERQIGAKFAQEIPNQYDLQTSGPAYDYVQSIGAKIAPAAEQDRSDLNYQFAVIDEPETVNAFAVPGGYVYVYTGLILLAESEAEVASVVAHEVAHVTRRHSANQLGAQIGLATLSDVALGEDPGRVTQIIASLATTGSMLKFSRDHEREADAYGMKYLIAAGYDSQAMVDFFEKLHGQSSGESTFASFLSTHPLTSERIASMKAERSRYGNPGGIVNREEHQAVKEAILSKN